MQYIAILIVLAAAMAAYLFYRINRQVVSEIQVLNPEAAKGTALVVYHPGITDFQEKVSYAFADGLVSAGWRVEVTTASSQAPTDLSSYDLLVVGGPTYGPSQPIARYVQGLGDLAGKRTVVIITGLGATDGALSNVGSLVKGANGNLVKSMALWSSRPNNEQDPRPNREVALDMATQAGKGFLPGE